jgi:hypothetical protein
VGGCVRACVHVYVCTYVCMSIQCLDTDRFKV